MDGGTVSFALFSLFECGVHDGTIARRSQTRRGQEDTRLDCSVEIRREGSDVDLG